VFRFAGVANGLTEFTNTSRKRQQQQKARKQYVLPFCVYGSPSEHHLQKQQNGHYVKIAIEGEDTKVCVGLSDVQ
jgi:hypothetical protein